MENISEKHLFISKRERLCIVQPSQKSWIFTVALPGISKDDEAEGEEDVRVRLARGNRPYNRTQ